MREDADSYCIKQPDNIGIVCTEHDKCENCGWNPQFLEKYRLKQKIKNRER